MAQWFGVYYNQLVGFSSEDICKKTSQAGPNFAAEIKTILKMVFTLSLTMKECVRMSEVRMELASLLAEPGRVTTLRL